MTFADITAPFLNTAELRMRIEALIGKPPARLFFVSRGVRAMFSLRTTPLKMNSSLTFSRRVGRAGQLLLNPRYPFPTAFSIRFNVSLATF
ncbi:MAG: hypothetical protein ABIZ04_12505 [Opitutus sp.]